MTAEEIRATKNDSDDGAWECAEWLREIAAQFAELNASRNKSEGYWLSGPDGSILELEPDIAGIAIAGETARREARR